MKKSILTLLVLLFIFSAYAQRTVKENETRNLQFGLKAGTVRSRITDLSKVLVSESYYTGYSFDNKDVWSFTGGIFLNYKFSESISAFYSELSYSRLANLLQYSDVDELKYDFTLRYECINWELFYKAYVFKGFCLGIGPRIGFNLTPGNLFYKSNKADLYGPDIRIQQQMRDVLKGRSNFSVGIMAGYEFSFGGSIDFRYYYGVSDVLETEVNNFHFIENRNESRFMQVTLGYVIPYNFKFF
jgi:hypothetical protein